MQLASRCATSVNPSTRAPTACSAEMDTTTPTVSVLHATAMRMPIQAANPASATQTPDTVWTAATTPPGLTANTAPLVSSETPLPGTAQPSVSHWRFNTITDRSNISSSATTTETRKKNKKAQIVLLLEWVRKYRGLEFHVSPAHAFIFVRCFLCKVSPQVRKSKIQMLLKNSD